MDHRKANPSPSPRMLPLHFADGDFFFFNHQGGAVDKDVKGSLIRLQEYNKVRKKEKNQVDK